MINKTLFLKNTKSNYKLVLIFIAVLTMYFTIIAGMYDPENLDMLDQLAALKLSPQLLKAMGFTLTDTSLLGFISSYFYGLLMLAFPMVCYIILGNKLVAGQVDKGSMACLLMTPNTRKKIITTQALFLITVVTSLVIFVTLLGSIYCEINFAGQLDIGKFVLLNLGVLLTHFAISGICFLSSCIFNETKNSLLFGSGIPIAFLLIQMVSNAGDKLDWLKYLTIFTLFNPTNIVAGEDFVFQFIILGIIGLALYTLGIIIFNKRDIPV